jgi:gluconolactonase
MFWTFEPVAGPFERGLGGVAWDGSGILFSAVAQSRIFRFDPATNKTTEFRKQTGRTNGLGFGPNGELYGCQEGSRRVIEFMPDDSARITAVQLDGRYHNFPTDLCTDRAGRIWFADPHSPVLAIGPQLFPTLDHASVLRLQRARNHQWFITRMSYDTIAPRAVLLSPDEMTLYVAEGTVTGRRELRAYPTVEGERLGRYAVLHTFGEDYRGPHRGIEGMCLDSAGNVVVCSGWRRSGPGPLVSVFSPSGAILESHTFPEDLPMRITFGDTQRDSLYVTTAGGHLYRAKSTGRSGFRRLALP